MNELATDLIVMVMLTIAACVVFAYLGYEWGYRRGYTVGRSDGRWDVIKGTKP